MSLINPFPQNDVQIFKYNQHAAVILEKLKSYYEENQFFDTILIAGTSHIKIQAHRFILSSLSEYFFDIFRGNPTSSQGNIILELKEIEASTLKYIIDFMYSGSIALRLETAEELLRAASFLKINILIESCCEFIEKNINTSNCLPWLRFAKELSLSRLKAKSLEFIYNHFEEVSNAKGLLVLSANELKDLLFNDNPHGDFEEHVFLSMVAWIDYDKSNRECLTLELLLMVRFQHLTAKFIVENRKTVCKSAESYELICSWLQWHLSPDTRTFDDHIYALRPRKSREELVCIQTSDLNNFVMQIYNPEVDLWTKEKHIPLWKNKKLYAAMIVIEDKLIVVGGRVSNDSPTKTVEYFDLHTSTWTECPPIKKERLMCQVADLKGILCVACSSNSIVDSIELYNFSARKRYDIKPLAELSQHCKVAAHNGVLYILDFMNGSLQTYDISSKEWVLKPMSKDYFCNVGFVAVSGFLYTLGGNFSNTVQRYNFSDDTWYEVAPLLHTCFDKKTTVFDNKIAICATTIKNGVVVEVYNPDNGTWSPLNRLSLKKCSVSANLCTLKAK